MTILNLSTVENHLWQSTLCIGAAWLLALALRSNRASLRYWIWFAASLKLLTPFSALVDLGSRFGWHTASELPVRESLPQWFTVVGSVSRPFGSQSAAGLAPATSPNHFGASIELILGAVWLSGVVVAFAFWIRKWRKIRRIQQKGTPLPLGLPIQAVSCMSAIEPGVFGIFRPVLLLPEGVTTRLRPEQFRTIVAHEMCHVRRQDNLTAAVHMLVEAILWFYPPVWWIGKRLIEERERACDEAVLQSGGEPGAYAEGILSVCRFYLESPLACASGISGSDLKRRIARIMTLGTAARLSASRKLLLASVAIVTMIGPVTFGILNTRALPLQLPPAEGSTPTVSFEVASIRLDRSGQSFSSRFTADRFLMERWRVKDLIQYAYDLKEAQVLGVPQWIDSERYDIEAKVEDTDMAKEQNLPPELRIALMRVRVRDLLAKRFGLRLHRSLKEMPVLALVVAGNGPKFSAAKPLPSPAPVPDARRAYMTMDGKQWVLTLKDLPLSYLVHMLSGQPEVAGRLLVDKTALTGLYDLKLQWEPQNLTSAPDPASEPSGATLFTALKEQLGLKVESRKEPVDVMEIDRIEKPSAN